jgi:hypothetical protein
MMVVMGPLFSVSTAMAFLLDSLNDKDSLWGALNI